MSTREADLALASVCVGDSLILKTSAKHSLATSSPSTSTPGAGSTVAHEANYQSKKQATQYEIKPKLTSLSSNEAESNVKFSTLG